MRNRRILLASRPSGWVSEANFRLEEAPLPRPAQGEVLVKNLWLSLDPYMRGRMSQQKSYVKGVEIGDVMTGQTVGEVVESRHAGFKPGDKVLTGSGWQLYGCLKGEELVKVDGTKAPLSYYLGCLGMPGLTAYFGLKEIGAPKPGETVVVSAASGAVGPCDPRAPDQRRRRPAVSGWRCCRRRSRPTCRGGRACPACP